MQKTKVTLLALVTIMFVSQGAMTAAYAGPNKESIAVREHQMKNREREFQRESQRTKEYDTPVRRDYIGNALISGGLRVTR